MQDIEKVILIVSFLTIFVLGHALSSAQGVGCDSWNCTHTDLSSGERMWSCEYWNCTKYPHMMTEETPNMTVVNCSVEDFIDYLENYTSLVNYTLNLSEKMTDLRMTRDGYKMNWDDCESDLLGLNKSMNDLSHELQSTKDNTIDKDVCEAQKSVISQNITSLQDDVAEQEFYGWLKLGIGVIGTAFVVWIFILKKPSVSKSDIEPTPGDTAYDPRRLKADSEIAQLKQSIEELRKERK